jgi:hypothetical protein
VTVCTATPGEDNVLLMISLGDPVHNRNIHIFVCQNGGRPFTEVKKVLETTWVILRKMHALVPTTAVPPPPESVMNPNSSLKPCRPWHGWQIRSRSQVKPGRCSGRFRSCCLTIPSQSSFLRA